MGKFAQVYSSDVTQKKRLEKGTIGPRLGRTGRSVRLAGRLKDVQKWAKSARKTQTARISPIVETALTHETVKLQLEANAGAKGHTEIVVGPIVKKDFVTDVETKPNGAEEGLRTDTGIQDAVNVFVA